MSITKEGPFYKALLTLHDTLEDIFNDEVDLTRQFMEENKLFKRNSNYSPKNLLIIAGELELLEKQRDRLLKIRYEISTYPSLN